MGNIGLEYMTYYHIGGAPSISFFEMLKNFSTIVTMSKLVFE